MECKSRGIIIIKSAIRVAAQNGFPSLNINIFACYKASICPKYDYVRSNIKESSAEDPNCSKKGRMLDIVMDTETLS